MKVKTLVLLLVTAATLTVVKIIDGGVRRRRTVALEMAEKANKFLASLAPEQRAKAALKFEDEGRFDWHFVPRERAGVSLKELSAEQRKLAHAFLQTGLSQRGYLKATTIMDLELVLRELEGRSFRDPDLYFFTVFGAPSAKDRWGWRVEGHHLSLNFTVVNGMMVATTPSFFGSNPAEVKQDGPRRGRRVLGAEEDIARQLLNALDEKQRAEAVFETTAPSDIVTGNAKQVDPLAPIGIPASHLTPPQIELLNKLIHEYTSTLQPELATERLEKLRRAGLEKVRFAWAGGFERGQPHYYRLQGPTFLVEYDNTQNNANHVHTVWRDFNGDFGRDLLREHYRAAPHAH